MTDFALFGECAGPGLSRRAVLCGAGAVGAGALLSNGAWARAPAVVTPRFSHVAQLVDEYVDGGRLPGAVAVLGQGLGAPQAIARGHSSKGESRPVDLDSLYRIYSMTKPVTGMAVMMLIDEGRLRLDQPLADILPAFARMQVQVTPDGPLSDVRPARAQITIRHLLTHTAGLGYTIVQKGPLKFAYEAAGLTPTRVGRVPVPDFDTLHPAPSLEVFADRLAKMPLIHEPGTHWSYSVALDLLGRVIEVVSGQPFDRFLHERIFLPAGMNSTWFQVPVRAAARMTTNYVYGGDISLPIDPARTSVYLDPPVFPFGGSGLVSSPRDYDRFLMMLLGEGRIGNTRVMSSRAVRLGTSDLLPPGVNTSAMIGGKAGFGAGGRVGLGADAGTFGWSGAAGTVGFVSFPHGLRAGLFVQYMPFNAFRLQEEFPAAVRADILETRVAA